MNKRLLIALLFVSTLLQAQDSITHYLNENALFFKNNELPAVIQSNLDKLPNGDFYMISQIHQAAFDIPLEQALLFSLHSKGVQYNISEYPHSSFFLVNEYLKTGDTSVLSLINKDAPFQFIKNVYTFNQQFEDKDQIRFYGIDYELYNYERGKPYKNALLYIYDKQAAALENTEFKPFFENLKNVEDTAMVQLTAIHKSFRTLMAKNENNLHNLFAAYANDVRLILTAPYKYKSIPTRDKWLFTRFQMVYNFLSVENPNPRFIASFGASHVKTKNAYNITHKLQNHKKSPVNEKVVKVGVQYFNGGEGVHINRPYFSVGIFDLKTTDTEATAVSKIFENRAENAALLHPDKINYLSKMVKGVDWLFLVDKQPFVKYWKWE